MKNKVLSFILALLILLSAVPVQALEGNLGYEGTSQTVEEKVKKETEENQKNIFAIKTVEEAESSKKQEDIELALVLVNDLKESKEKTKLLERLEVVQVQEQAEVKKDGLNKEKVIVQTVGFKEENNDTYNADFLPSIKNLAEANGDNISSVLAETPVVSAAKVDKNIDHIIKEVQDYEINTVPNPSFASVYGEWTVLSLARSGASVPTNYYEDYYKRIEETVRTKIIEGEKLHETLSTDNSRMIVALTSIGKNPKDVAGHNLLVGLNDFDYLLKQGINGPTWALIAFDSYKYEIPLNADPSKEVTRQKLVDYILTQEVTDSKGVKAGWRLGGPDDTAGASSGPNIDITAMVMYALAPYKNQVKVQEALDRAVNYLSNKQKDPGGFTDRLMSWDNSEAISQSVIALSALGIDADSNPKFVKEGNSLLDALLSFQDEKTKGFRHINNMGVNAMATDQAFEALIAYNRFVKGQKALFDMTDVSLDPLLTGIEVVKHPNKKSYKVGEFFDPTGLEVYKVYDNGNRSRLDNSELTLSVPDMSTLGNKTISVSYKNHQATFIIKVEEDGAVTEAKLTGIEIIKNPSKINYDIGERINLSGMEVLGRYNDGTQKKISLADLFITSPNMTEAGEKEVIVSYGGFTDRFHIQVLPARLQGIEIIRKPYKVQYEKGEAIDLSGLKVEAYYSDKSSKILNNGKYQVSSVNMDKAGIKNIVISYGGKSDSFSINVLETGVQSAKATISVTVPPGPTVYESGWVMQPTKEFEIIEGVDTAFSILEKTGLNLKYNSHATYAGHYVSSIEGLAEFDGGPWSGWMYRVNGWFPNYSSSLYKLKNNDKVEWIYTRNLGKDIGGYIEGIENDDGLGNKPINVKVSSTQGGMVYPSGKVQITKDKPVTLVFKAKEGYLLTDIYINGSSIGLADTFTLTDKNVKEGDVIKGIFKKSDVLTKEEKLELEKKKEETLKKLEEEKKNQEDKKIFNDIKGHWAESRILESYNKGYFKGIGDGLFGPNVKMTRGMFVTVLGRMAKAEKASGQSLFTDVDINDYYAPYVKWAHENKIIQGVGNQRFAPNREITRQEMARMMKSYLEYKEINLPEGDLEKVADGEEIAPWARESVASMYKIGLLHGKEDGKFHPRDSSTRAEVATVVISLENIR